MRTLGHRFLLTASVLLFAFGCVAGPRPPVHHQQRHRLSGQKKSCPPGHRWSDGRCHDTGKGHDPGKHGRKHKHKH